MILKMDFYSFVIQYHQNCDKFVIARPYEVIPSAQNNNFILQSSVFVITKLLNLVPRNQHEIIVQGIKIQKIKQPQYLSTAD